MKRTIVLLDAQRRRRAHEAIDESPDGYVVSIGEPTRNEDQNSRFHAMCGDIAKQAEWQGKKRKPSEWKFLLVSGHAIATKEGAEMLPGLEGEFLNLRESTAQMSRRRASSLIDYTRAWGDMHGIVWSEPATD